MSRGCETGGGGGGGGGGGISRGCETDGGGISRAASAAGDVAQASLALLLWRAHSRDRFASGVRACSSCSGTEVRTLAGAGGGFMLRDDDASRCAASYDSALRMRAAAKESAVVAMLSKS